MPLPSGVRFSFLALVSIDKMLSVPSFERPSLAQCFLMSCVIGFLCAFTNAKTNSLALTANFLRRLFPLAAGAFAAITASLRPRWVDLVPRASQTRARVASMAAMDSACCWRCSSSCWMDWGRTARELVVGICFFLL